MVRLSDLIDLDAGGTTRESLSHKRHWGLEAPQSRSEKPVEASCSFCLEENDARCTYVNEAPMKKLISDELDKRANTGRNTPSVVARLMGLDSLPVDAKPSVMKKNDTMQERVSPSKEEQSRKVSSRPSVFDPFDSRRSSNSLKFDRPQPREHPQEEEQSIKVSSRPSVFDSFDRRSSSNSLKFNNPRPREHPQEEELRKFKKEFEAYQAAARFKECSKFVELSTNKDQWLARSRHLNKEKLVLYTNNSMRKTGTERSEELKGLAVTENKTEFLAAARNRTNRVWNVKSSSAQRHDFASVPRKIVILRPVSDRTRNNEESWASSPRISEDGSSIEEFLQEVKERLELVLQEKSFRKTIETSDAKKIAQCIAKQARESVTRGVRTTLPRSESTRSYRSEIQLDGAGSPEFSYRDTRRFSTERSSNVPRDDSTHDIDKHGRGSHGDEMKDESDMLSRYFRQDLGDDVMIDQKLFHRNLVRSLSAPVSRPSFGKLLLEDQHMLTGARIRRKHEAIEEVTVNVKKWRKEKFNLKMKVSSFKYRFVLRGRLFGRKIKSLEESHGDKQIHMKDHLNASTVASKFSERQENSTEVPPSPASVCSTSNEEFWRQTDNFSPSSSSVSDVNPLDDTEIPHVFKEISSNLNALRRQLNQLETYDSEETVIDEEPIQEEITEINDPAEAFIRDLLVASGLYDGSCDTYLSKWDPLGKPVSNQVLEEVEESYRHKTNDDKEGSSTDDHQFEKLNHKLLFDFLNEVLPGLLGNTSTRAPRRKKLLECVWEIARVSSDMSSQSLETILARDLECTRWDGLVDEDVNALGKDVEYQIFRDLIHEMINDMHP